MQTRSYYMKDTKKNKNVLKFLKKEGFVSYFYATKKRIKVFLKQDYTTYLKRHPSSKTLRINLMYILTSEIWKYPLKPGVFLLNTIFGVIPERVLKRKSKGGRILTYIG